MNAWDVASFLSYWAVVLAFGYLAIGVLVTILMLVRWHFMGNRYTVFNPRLIYRMLPWLLFSWPVSLYVVGSSTLLNFRVRRAMRRLERRYGND